jgi:hypothetical protein
MEFKAFNTQTVIELFEIWFLSRFIPLRIMILQIGLRDLSFWIKYIGKSWIPHSGRIWFLAIALRLTPYANR